MRKFLPFKMLLTKKQSLQFISLLLVLLFMGTGSIAQKVLRNPIVTEGQLIKVIPSLKDYVAPAGFVPKITRKGDKVIGEDDDNEFIQRIQYNKKVVKDPVVQRFAATPAANTNSPINGIVNTPPPTPNNFSGGLITQNFDGMGYTNVAPADPNMTAGPNHIIQMINGGAGSYLKIWDRNGVQLLAQIYMTTLVAGTGYSGSGDPVALYDQFADRYMLTEFGNVGGGNINTMVVFVSVTNNPLGAWNVYKFTDNTFFPDYPHWGIWPNVLYATTNDFNVTPGGSSVWAFNKAQMIAGNPTAQLQRFRLSFQSQPVNISGPTPPTTTGTVGNFMYYIDNDFNPNPGAADSIGMIKFTPDFAVPANTTLTWSQALVTAPFKSNVCGGRNCVPS